MYSIDQFYFYIFCYNFFSIKKEQNFISCNVDIIKQVVFNIIYFEKSFSNVSKSFTFNKKMFNSVGCLAYYTMRLLFLIDLFGFFCLMAYQSF